MVRNSCLCANCLIFLYLVRWCLQIIVNPGDSCWYINVLDTLKDKA